jgi:hypothetical protein
MELIERYLEAVKFWLPKRQKYDIIAELSADIYAQIEERETALGRKLTEAEVEEILKQRGHPLLVANRFLPQESLIGPVFFLIYLFVLKVFAFGYLLPATLVWIGLMIFSPAYRMEQTHLSWFTPFASLFSTLWVATCIFITPLTLGFAGLERNQARIHFFDRWNPRKLPARPQSLPDPAFILRRRGGRQPDLLCLVGRLRTFPRGAGRLIAAPFLPSAMALVLLGLPRAGIGQCRAFGHEPAASLLVCKSRQASPVLRWRGSGALLLAHAGQHPGRNLHSKPARRKSDWPHPDHQSLDDHALSGGNRRRTGCDRNRHLSNRAAETGRRTLFAVIGRNNSL